MLQSKQHPSVFTSICRQSRVIKIVRLNAGKKRCLINASLLHSLHFVEMRLHVDTNTNRAESLHFLDLLLD